MSSPVSRLVRAFAVRSAAACCLAGLLASSARQDGSRRDGDRLAKLTRRLDRVGGVAAIDPADLAHRLCEDAQRDARGTTPGPPLLFDVRTAEEYAVGRIAGALRLEPGARAVPDGAVDAIRGRDVVLYCAVGVRSTLAASALEETLTAAGARSVSNLAGGLFAWGAAGLPMVDAAGPTSRIHPYDPRWSRLLAPRASTSMPPAAEAAGEAHARAD